MPSKKFIAHFQPQAWVRDNAIDVDDEGPDTWDCTEELLRLSQTPSTAPIKQGTGASMIDMTQVEAAIDKGSSWLDRDDLLKGDPNAPEWVREWSGPFTITVEEAA